MNQLFSIIFYKKKLWHMTALMIQHCIYSMKINMHIPVIYPRLLENFFQVLSLARLLTAFGFLLRCSSADRNFLEEILDKHNLNRVVEWSTKWQLVFISLNMYFVNLKRSCGGTGQQ